MRPLGQLVRVVTGYDPDHCGMPSRYLGTTGRIVGVRQADPLLYEIRTISAKEYGKKIGGGFVLLVYSDEIRPVKKAGK